MKSCPVLKDIGQAFVLYSKTIEREE